MGDLVDLSPPSHEGNQEFIFSHTDSSAEVPQVLHVHQLLAVAPEC